MRLLIDNIDQHATRTALKGDKFVTNQSNIRSLPGSSRVDLPCVSPSLLLPLLPPAFLLASVVVMVVVAERLTPAVPMEVNRSMDKCESSRHV